MAGYGLSPLEVCRIIEEAFLPEKCVCRCPDGISLTVQVMPKDRPDKARSFVGIPIAPLSSSRAIANLVIELRAEILEGSYENATTQMSQTG